MLAMIGIASADVYAFTDSYDTMSMQGILTFDENGIINGAVVAGTNNGAMDVTQYAETENGNVLVYQYGDIEGGAGFATTAARDGSGNSGGSFASVTDGSMWMGQGTVAGSTSFQSNLDAAGVFTSETGSQVSAVMPDMSLTLGGIATGQVAEIEGASGYASTGARNVNGASARNAASFIAGGMILAQGSASGDLSLILSDRIEAYGSALGDVEEPGTYGLNVGAAIAAQGVEIIGTSGSASTTVTNSHGATASSAASFSNGGMGAIQAGIGYNVDLTHPVSSEGDPVDLALGGVIVGQGVDMEGSAGSASTTVSDGNGASGQSSSSFTNGGMGAIQAGAAGDVTLNVPDIIALDGMDLSLEAGGAIVGQGVDMGGDTGSASTAVTDGQGNFARTSAAFTDGEMGAIQAGAAGDASLGLSDIPIIVSDASLDAGGAIAGQGVMIRAREGGSASTTVTNAHGASAQATSSFANRGRMGVLQVAGTADASLGIGDPLTTSSPSASTPLSEGNTEDILSAGVIFAGQDGYVNGRNGAASTSVTGVNGNSAGNSASFTRRGSMEFTQASGGLTADLNPDSPTTDDLSVVLSYQDTYSDSFRNIAASSYSQTAGNSLVQMNALATDSPARDGSFDTTQFAGGVTSGSLDIAVGGLEVQMDDVTTGFASGYSSDSDGNTASVRANVNRGAGKLNIGDTSGIPTGIIAGAGDIGGISGAIAVHDDVLIRGRSGGLRTEAGNSTGGSAYVDAEFSEGGKLMSENGPFLGMTGAALSVQYEGTNYMGAAEWNLNSTSSNTNIETEITDIAKPTPATNPGTYDAYSYNLPPGILPSPIPNPNSEIWRHP